MKLHSNSISAARSSPGPVIILGQGPLRVRWEQLPSWAKRSLVKNIALPEPRELAARLRTLKPSAVLWENTSTPDRLTGEMSNWPKEIPLLLRYPQPLDPEVDRKLLHILRRRGSGIRLSHPLRFWPPACRMQEICSSGVMGEITAIEIHLTLPARRSETAAWAAADYDFFDFACRLIGIPFQYRHWHRIKNDNCCRQLCLRSPNEIVISLRAGDPSRPDLSPRIQIIGRNGSLILTMQPGDRTTGNIQPENYWHLQRRFNPEINRHSLRSLMIKDHDPVGLELDWFLTDCVGPDTIKSESG